jgi:hypothetical protein
MLINAILELKTDLQCPASVCSVVGQAWESQHLTASILLDFHSASPLRFYNGAQHETYQKQTSTCRSTRLQAKNHKRTQWKFRHNHYLLSYWTTGTMNRYNYWPDKHQGKKYWHHRILIWTRGVELRAASNCVKFIPRVIWEAVLHHTWLLMKLMKIVHHNKYHNTCRHLAPAYRWVWISHAHHAKHQHIYEHWIALGFVRSNICTYSTHDLNLTKFAIVQEIILRDFDVERVKCGDSKGGPTQVTHELIRPPKMSLICIQKFVHWITSLSQTVSIWLYIAVVRCTAELRRSK